MTAPVYPPMSTTENLQLVHRIITVMAKTDDSDFILWRAEAGGAVKAYVIINDVFAWAFADLEEITIDNILAFERAAKDVMAANVGKDNDDIGMATGILFACRMRKLLPMKHNGGYGVHASVIPLIEAVA